VAEGEARASFQNTHNNQEIKHGQPRSKTYYEYSQEAFKRGDYDIAIFMVEQAAQLA
jgi:HEPN domain.